MNIVVHIPLSMRGLTNGQGRISARGKTVAEVIDDLDAAYPGVRALLLNGSSVKRFINLYVGEDDIRFRSGLETELHEGDSLTILPVIAGG